MIAEARDATSFGYAEIGAKPSRVALGQSRMKRFSLFLVIGFIAAFWNGLVGLFAYSIFSQKLAWLSIFPLLFLLPFVFVGVLLLVAAAVSFFSVFSPLLVLELDTTALAPGDRVRVRWTFRGPGQPTRLQLALEGEEEVEYTRGTDSVRDSRVFSSLIFGDVGPELLRTKSGELFLNVPREAVPSFDAPHNSIAWFLRAHASVPLVPDTFEEHRVVIRVTR